MFSAVGQCKWHWLQIHNGRHIDWLMNEISVSHSNRKSSIWSIYLCSRQQTYITEADISIILVTVLYSLWCLREGNETNKSVFPQHMVCHCITFLLSCLHQSSVIVYSFKGQLENNYIMSICLQHFISGGKHSKITKWADEEILTITEPSSDYF